MLYCRTVGSLTQVNEAIPRSTVYSSSQETTSTDFILVVSKAPNFQNFTCQPLL
uniref:Uncharacterized protein n=1 Tax=Ascaris lumbricoides TaxID=6252 RepID=A0A0M3HW92_ASCLU